MDPELDSPIDMRGVVVTPTGNFLESMMGQQEKGAYTPTGVDIITHAKEAGFNDDEIGATVAQLRKEASDAGFGQGEIDTYFGQPPFDATPIKKLVGDNIKQATKPEGADGQPKPVNSFMDALEFGLQSSVSGLLVRGKTPDKQMTEDAPMASRVVAGMATMAGDLPFMAGGALAGGANPITGTAGAFALPAGMRKILMDKYENGEATTFGEFWERASGAMIETGKAWITGAAVGGVGKAVGVAPIASPTAKSAATLASEVTTMVTVGKALEGEIPQARDFADAAVVIFGVKAGVKGAAKLRKIYAEKGVKPADLVADMEKDPTILQDVLADNVEVPGAYNPMATKANLAAAVRHNAEGVRAKTGMEPAEAVRAGLYTIDNEGHYRENVPGAMMDMGKAAVEVKPKDTLATTDLPEYAQGAIMAEQRARQTNDGVDAHLVDAEWELKTVTMLNELYGKNKMLFHGTFTHRGSMTKGPIVLDYDGTVLDGNNRVFEALNRGETHIEAYRPVKRGVAAAGGGGQEPPKPEPGLFHATHKADLTQLDPREVKGIDSVGTWFTSSADHAKKLYGPNVKQAEPLEGKNLLEAHTDNFNEFFFSNKNLFEDVFGHQPTDAEMTALRSPGRGLDPKVRAEHDAKRTKYVQAFRAMLEKSGYDGVIFKQSRIDLKSVQRASGEELAPHDVTVLFNKEPIKVTDVANGGGQEPPKPPTPPAPPKEPDNPLYAKHIEKTPEQRVLSRISIGAKDTKEPMTWSRLYTMVVDDLHPIEQAVKAATKGQKLETANDPYQLARLSRGSFGKANQMLEYGTYDFKTYENNGPALKEILKPVKKNLDGLRAYIASKRAIELQGRQIETGIDHDAAKEVVKAGRDTYEPIMRELVSYQNKVSKHLLDSGIISQKTYDLMKEANKEYVPFFRVMDDGGPGGPKAGNTVKNPIKGIDGSERIIVDPLESIIKNTYVYTQLAERNVVMQKFVDLGFGKKVAPAVRQVTATDKEMTKFLNDNGIDQVPEELLTIFRTVRQPLKDNEIGLFREGKWEVREVEPDIAAAFKGMDAESANVLVKILAIPARTLRAGAVLSPDFMGRNILRDQTMAFALSKSGYLPFIDLVRGFMSIVKKDEHFQNWLKSGGAQSTFAAMDRQYMRDSLEALTKNTGLGSRAWNVVKSPLDLLRAISELAENSTRLGVFKQSMKHGVNDKASLQEAAMVAREGTLDFQRIGSKMRAANMIATFLNAHVQGLDRVARGFHDDPFGMTMRAGISITVPSMLLWMANKDDERYKELPRWEKDLFWHILTKDTIYRVPKPHELGLIFGSVPERLLENFLTDNPDAAKDIEKSLIQAFAPNMIPTGMNPIIEQFANRSLFTGSPIIPAELEKQLPEYQYTSYTTETSKALGRILGSFPGFTKRAASDDEPLIGGVARSIASPILMENYIRAWTGGLGMYLLQLGDKGLREAHVLPDPVKPASTLADIPFVKAFVSRYPSASAQSIQDFHDHYFANKKIRDTWEARKQEGDLVAMKKVDALDKSAIAKLDGFQNTLTQQGQLVRMIAKNPVWTADEKRQLIDSAYSRMIEVSRFGKTLLRQLDEKMNAQP